MISVNCLCLVIINKSTLLPPIAFVSFLIATQSKRFSGLPMAAALLS